MTKPLTCPFCGSKAKAVQATPTAYCVACCSYWMCGAQGPDRKGHNEAIDVWNKRHQAHSETLQYAAQLVNNMYRGTKSEDRAIAIDEARDLLIAEANDKSSAMKDD